MEGREEQGVFRFGRQFAVEPSPQVLRRQLRRGSVSIDPDVALAFFDRELGAAVEVGVEFRPVGQPVPVEVIPDAEDFFRSTFPGQHEPDIRIIGAERLERGQKFLNRILSSEDRHVRRDDLRVGGCA